MTTITVSDKQGNTTNLLGANTVCPQQDLKLPRLSESLTNIEEKLEIILAKLKDLEIRLQKIEASTNNMDRHISFIERIYEKIKEPFVALLSWNPLSTPLLLPATAS